MLIDRLNRSRARQTRTCALCDVTTGTLHRCETGHICPQCLKKGMQGRDVTTKLVKATDLDEKVSPNLFAIDVPPESMQSSILPAQELPSHLTAEIVANDASAHRHELIGNLGNDAMALSLDMELDNQPRSKQEVMLAHQMGVAHKLALEASGKAFFAPEVVDQVRLLNASARLFEVFQKAMLTLQRIRTGGNQQIVVQHVNVGQGGKAIVGNVHRGAETK